MELRQPHRIRELATRLAGTVGEARKQSRAHKV
jgi:hypothetical protein